MRSRVRGYVLVSVAVAATAAACGSSDESIFQPGGPDGGILGDGGANPDGSIFQDPTDSGGHSTGSCKPRTCADADANCGPIGDGCGGLIQCGTCTGSEACGGGGKPSKCGGATNCVPLTGANDGSGACAGKCGPLADGCGGLIQCGGCTAPQTCGGGGNPSVCGGSSACVPSLKADVCTGAAPCGQVGDGCGGIIDCGGCAPGLACGAITPSQCGSSATSDGGTCTKTKTSCAAGECGPFPDGCGGVVTCGGCTAPETCGGGGVASHCGGSGACVPKTCAGQGANCGLIQDGCGGLANNGDPCGTCSGGQVCGGGNPGTANVCGGGASCTKRTTCNPNECGPVADGCGGTLTCPGCGPGQTCGATTPSVCGGGGTSTCTAGLCTQLPTCTPGTTTSISGYVYAGTVPQPKNGTHPAAAITPDPLYHALVYIPNQLSDIPAITDGANKCVTCGSETDGKSLVQTYTDTSGHFVLTGVPAGAHIPVVIQLGKWRRVVNLNVNQCTQNTLTDSELTRLPRKQHETIGDDTGAIHNYNNIPLTSISTGEADPLECILWKMGVDQTEFTRPSGNGRIRLYHGDGTGERPPDGSTTSETNLLPVAGTTPNAALSGSDQVIFGCEGGSSKYGDLTMDQANALNQYTINGGRVFLTHLRWPYLAHSNANGNGLASPAFPWQSTVTSWHPTAAAPAAGPWTALIDNPAGNQKLADFATWLRNVNASIGVTPPPDNKTEVAIYKAGFEINPNGVNAAQATQYIYVPSPVLHSGDTPSVLHYQFDVPLRPSTDQCGRVVFSVFHANPGAAVNNNSFPTGCGPFSNNKDALGRTMPDALSAQEKILEFMLYDLGSCIAPEVPPPPVSCTPRTTCPPNTCGPIADGCGGVIPGPTGNGSCGTCSPPQTCGGGGTPSVCGGTGCTPRTSCPAGINCGPYSDGCGGTLNCGDCAPPEVCGANNNPGKCGSVSCSSLTCGAQGFNCGPAGDGCGNAIDCGSCINPGETCGGGGSASVCGNSTCVPKTCAAYPGANCGKVADGCGGVVDCGTCPVGQVCGGGLPDGGPGKHNVCGFSSCTPQTCAAVGAQCGSIGDGCGGQLECGPCLVPGQHCGGGGPNKCGGCTPTTCQAIGAECGPAGDGCGGLLDCGTCPIAGDTCGGGGIAFKCGHPDIK
jgi:hypothetical protein